jgi:GWxTD domain-containing protein
MKYAPYSFLLLIMLQVACFTSSRSRAPQKPSVINLSRMYNPAASRLHPAYTIYHNTASSSLLLVKIFPVELLYSGTIQPNKLLGQVSLTYVLTDIENINRPVVADSGQITYTFEREHADKRFITQISLKAEDGKQYQLMLIARDMVRREEILSYLYVDKRSNLSAQNFLVTLPGENTPVFEPNVVGSSLFRLESRNKDHDSIYVKYYGQVIPLPKPSFSLIRERDFLEQPDSLWIFPFGKGVSYQLNYEGIYHFQLDTSRMEGITLFNFGESYPKVQEVSQLVEPLAYLTTTTEMENIDNAANQKLAVDNFWLEKAGNIEKARELIRVYYNRVYYSNYYFTSFKPGWKTDRGMIFIIYGPPQTVKALPDQEKWIYYKNNFSTSVTFTFYHTPTAYALDNFTLQRADNYDTYWRQAVETWRKGNIYMIE